MENYYYIFERPGSRHTCPGCLRKKEFTRYVHIETGEPLSDDVGICNNSQKCGYHKTPGQYFHEKPETNYMPLSKVVKFVPPPKNTPSYISHEILEQTIARKDSNNFITYLKSIFPSGTVAHLIERYKIGTATKPWGGGTVFWQVDVNGNVRAGKIMLLDAVTGKRVKEPFNHFQWVHTLLERAGSVSKFALEQCFFGEHLVKDADTIAVVESEKTAIVASVFYPEYTWIATGSLAGLTQEKCKVLTGKNVVLFPDKGCAKTWAEKAIKFINRDVKVSGLLERLDYIPKGSDLEDYLKHVGAIGTEQEETLKDGTVIKLHPAGYPLDWDLKRSA